MAIKISRAALDGVKTDANSTQNIVNTWALSYWAKWPTPANYSVVGADQFMGRNDGSANGWDIWKTDPVAQSGAREWFESNGVGAFTSTSFDAFYDGAWHHWMWYKHGTNNVGIYVDAGFIENAAVPQANPPGVGSMSFRINLPRSGPGTWGATGEISHVKLFSNISYDIATLAKILYESRGADGLTDGVIAHYPLDFGNNGSVIATNEPDLSGLSNHFATVNGKTKNTVFIVARDMWINANITASGTAGTAGASNVGTTNRYGDGGGGGGSGGSIFLIAQNSIEITSSSTINVSGGNGAVGGSATLGSGSNAAGGGGGGGAGGCIVIRCKVLTNNGTQTYAKGSGGAAGTASGGSSQHAGTNGTDGNDGMLRVFEYDDWTTNGITDNSIFPLNAFSFAFLE